MEEVVFRNLRARVRWERVFGKKVWAEVAEGNASGEFCWLIPPIQESRNWCLHVQISIIPRRVSAQNCNNLQDYDLC